MKKMSSAPVPTAILLLLIAAGEGARILGVFPLVSKSHMIVNLAPLKELARRGHQVTVYSPFPEEDALNFTCHRIGVNMESIAQLRSLLQSAFHLRDKNLLQVKYLLWAMGEMVSQIMLESTIIQELFQSNGRYDIIVVDTDYSETLMAFAHRFKAHLIQICSNGGSSWMDDWFGNPAPYSHVPDINLGFSDRMSFWERLQNALFGTLSFFGRHFYSLPKQDALLKKYFNQTKHLPSVSELEAGTSLLLLNSHFSIDYPRPLMPKMVQVGGMHIKPPQKLPKDLQEFLDGAKDGVIYFSMGSILKGADFPEEYKKVFLQVFSKLKQKVLWKFETENLQGLSENVKVEKWLPQSDILAHPNVRVFITHAGLLSCQEAIARGVPVIGIPIFGDQLFNMKRAVKSGYGILLTYENISVSSLTWALEEVLQNPIYTQNVKKMSRLCLDQPMTPLDTAVYWIEYVLRNNGTSHIRSAAVDLYWFQYQLLDVIGFLAMGTVGFLLTIFILFRNLYRMCTRKSPVAVSQKKRKKK